MRRTSALAGIIGLVLLIFGLVDYFIATGFRVFVAVNLVAGAFAIVLWATSSRDALAGMVGRRSTRYGANAIVYTAAFIGVLVAVNYLSSRYHRRFDATEQGVFSLASQSVNTVKNLKKPIKFYGFFEGGESAAARSLYESYAYGSHNVSFELVDPDKHPELAERYKVSTMGTTHIQYGGDTGEGTNVTELNEENLTNGIIKVTRNNKKIVYFLDGEGEPNPDDMQGPTGFGTVRQALEGEGFDVKKLVLATSPKVPEDCSVLVVAGPTKPLTQHVLDEVNAYLKRGGRVVAMLQPPRPDQPIDESGLIKLVGDWGVKVGNDVVVDQVVRLFAGPALGLNPVVATYAEHPATHGFTQRTVFPMTRSLDATSKPGLTITPLARTSDTSWAETDLDGIFRHQTATLDAKDTRGPIAVCEAVQADLKTLGDADKGEARLLVFGDTDFADNQNISTFFNRDFFVNGLDWLAGEENAVSIRPRSMRASRFRLTVDQFSIVFALSVLLLPELLLIVGIAVWWERRN